MAIPQTRARAPGRYVFTSNVLVHRRVLEACPFDEAFAVLDARGASITATQLAAQTGLARAQLDQAQKECDRVKALFQSGAISQAEFDRQT